MRCMPSREPRSSRVPRFHVVDERLPRVLIQWRNVLVITFTLQGVNKNQIGFYLFQRNCNLPFNGNPSLTYCSYVRKA